MFWHSILPSQIRLQKYQGGVPKLWTPPKELTSFKNFGCHLPHFSRKSSSISHHTSTISLHYYSMENTKMLQLQFAIS